MNRPQQKLLSNGKTCAGTFRTKADNKSKNNYDCDLWPQQNYDIVIVIQATKHFVPSIEAILFHVQDQCGTSDSYEEELSLSESENRE